MEIGSLWSMMWGDWTGAFFWRRLRPENLQVHWPEGNVIIRRGVVDTLGGVPDYNALARVEPIIR